MNTINNTPEIAQVVKAVKELVSFRAKPKLIPIVCNDVPYKRYDDEKQELVNDTASFRFYIWDRPSLAQFFELSSIATRGDKVDPSEMFRITLNIMLDSEGKMIQSEDEPLPVPFLVAAATEIMSFLGN